MDAAAINVEKATDDDSVITFTEGIIGVPRARRFQLLERAGSNVRVLRCLDVPGFALSVIEASEVDRGYRPKLSPRARGALDIDPNDPVLLLAITTLTDDGPRANLRAPVVVNARARRAAQVILEGSDYELSAPVPQVAVREP